MNVNTKGKSPKQGLTSAEDLTMELPEELNMKHLLYYIGCSVVAYNYLHYICIIAERDKRFGRKVCVELQRYII